MAPQMVLSQRSNKANGSSQQRNVGLNFSSNLYVSQETYDEIDGLQLPKRQSDLFAYAFGGVENDNNKDVREYVKKANDKLCHTLGDESIAANMLRLRYAQMRQAGTNGGEIRTKMDTVWYRGNMTKTLLPVVANAAPFIKDVGVLQFSYGDIPEPSSEGAETVLGTHFDHELTTSPFQWVLSPFRGMAFPLRVLGTMALHKGINTIHDRWQPGYFAGLGNSRKNMGVLAEQFRKDSAEAENFLDRGPAAAALRQEYGEDGRLLLKKMMHEVNLSAYNYMLAFQEKPSKFMPVDDQLAESGATSESLQLMIARLEVARFINTKGKQSVVEEWRPSAAFPGIDAQSVVKVPHSEGAQPSSRARHDESGQVDFDSIERWDYSPSLSDVLNRIERSASEYFSSTTNGKQAKSPLDANLSAARKGDANALLDLAKLCEDGILGILGIKGAEARRYAKQLYIPVANKGNVEAQYRLGLLHADKRFTVRDGLRNDNVAMEWLTKAAEQGHPEAQAELGLMHAELSLMHEAGRSGLDTHEAALAYKWCRSAIKAGVDRADVFFSLGHLYQNGMSNTPTGKGRIAIMEKWYLAAVKKKHVGAMRELGLAHFNDTPGLVGWSDGSSKGANNIDAARYLQMAADENDPAAIYYLGEMYLSNKHQSIKGPKAKEAAADHFKRAADAGIVEAEYIKIKAHLALAKLYTDKLAYPDGGKSQTAAAVDLYTPLAKKGNLDAQLALADIYKAKAKRRNERASAVDPADNQMRAEYLALAASANQKLAKYLTLAANHHEANPRIAYELAELYFYRTPGLGSELDCDKLAVQWYTQAANSGVPDAQFKLGYMYEIGRVDDDLTDQEHVALAEEWYIKAADAEHVEAPCALGLMHLTRVPGLTGSGETEEARDADAAQYLQMAADKKNPVARYFLGVMRLTGCTSIKSLETKEAAIDYIRFAADNGYALAQHKLGLLLAGGETGIKDDGKPDYQEAARRFGEAVKQEHWEAYCELAKLYQGGFVHPEGGKSPDAAAEDLYEQAANKGNLLVAQLALVDLYEAKAKQSIKRGSAVDPAVDQKIAKYLALAVKNGSADAQYKLGSRLLASCKGLPAEEAEQKATEAIELLEQAAQQGHPNAYYKLGYLHEEPRHFGLSKEPDLAKAVELYLVAVEKKVADAQYRLGELYRLRVPYRTGEVVPGCVDEKDADKEAKRLLQLASNQGHPHARFCYGLMLVDDLESSGSDRMLGRKMMEDAASQGYPDLQYVLATCFLDYNPEERKSLTDEGIKWLEKAAAQSYEPALQKLEYLCVKGRLSPEQIKRAWGYFQKAAEKGNIASMLFLGWMSEAGLGMSKEGLALLKPDYIAAYSYYQKAVKKDDSNGYAHFRLGALTEAGYNDYLDKGEIAHRKAVEHYKRAADRGNPQAKDALNRMREKGLGGLSKDTSPNEEAVPEPKATVKKGSQAAKNVTWASLKVPPIGQTTPLPKAYIAPSGETVRSLKVKAAVEKRSQAAKADLASLKVPPLGKATPLPKASMPPPPHSGSSTTMQKPLGVVKNSAPLPWEKKILSDLKKYTPATDAWFKNNNYTVVKNGGEGLNCLLISLLQHANELKHATGKYNEPDQKIVQNFRTQLEKLHPAAIQTDEMLAVFSDNDAILNDAIKLIRKEMGVELDPVIVYPTKKGHPEGAANEKIMIGSKKNLIVYGRNGEQHFEAVHAK